MARHLVVTLADAQFLDPARQLLSCVHFQAGWDGDLMLLAHDVPDAELEPFRERGILVRPCSSRVAGEQGDLFHPPTVLSKFEIFSPDFRRWENVIYLDGDMMFWASLDGLSKVRGLRAVCERRPIAGQYARRVDHPALAAELETRFDLTRPAFNSGLLAFSTDVIRTDTVERLQALYRRYSELQAHPFGDQPALNLHFYGRWKLLPDFYAAIRDHSARHFFLEEDALRMIGKHFAGFPRPWDADHPLHGAWRDNLERFESLDARQPRPPRARWTAAEVRRYWAWLRLRRRVVLSGRGLVQGWTRLGRTAPARRARWLGRRLAAWRSRGDA